MRRVVRADRWAWGLCGLATAAALAVPGTFLIVSAGSSAPASAGSPHQARVPMAEIETRTLTVPQLVTSLDVQGYEGLIQVTAAPVTHVEVTEMIAYYGPAGQPPSVEQSVSGGRLSLADPACANDECSVSFIVRVPPSVTVTAAGGPLSISGIAGANLDSDGAPVIATNIHGPLSVSTHGGPLQISGLTGPLFAATGGGQVAATGLTAATAAVTTGGGLAQLRFSAPPQSVTVSTGGGPATLGLPGGPYALTANSDGAPQLIRIATSAAALRSITVTTSGGPVDIGSGRATLGSQPQPPTAKIALPFGVIHLRGLPALTVVAPRPKTGSPSAWVAIAGSSRRAVWVSVPADNGRTSASRNAQATVDRVIRRHHTVHVVLHWSQAWLQLTTGE